VRSSHAPLVTHSPARFEESGNFPFKQHTFVTRFNVLEESYKKDFTFHSWNRSKEFRSGLDTEIPGADFPLCFRIILNKNYIITLSPFIVIIGRICLSDLFVKIAAPLYIFFFLTILNNSTKFSKYIGEFLLQIKMKILSFSYCANIAQDNLQCIVYKQTHL